MYGFIWRHLPGPAWLKAIEALILTAGIVYVLDGLFWLPIIWTHSLVVAIGAVRRC